MQQKNDDGTHSPRSVSSMPESAAMTYDEVSMQRSQDFFMALQELKNLRPQLYSAAEYCESSYIYSDQKQAVLENLKDYSVKALVNAVDHLGTVAYKLNDLLNQQTSELAATEIRVSCLSQRVLACQEYTDREGFTQQILIKDFPKHHKHYTFPDPNDPEESFDAAESTLETSDLVKSEFKSSSHLLLEVNKADGANGYHLKKGTGSEAEIVSASDYRKVPLHQQKFKEEAGQDGGTGTLSWFFAAEGQGDTKSEAPQNIQPLKRDGYNAPFTATRGDKGYSGKAKFATQPKKNVMDEKKSLSSLMSFEEAKFRQLRQPHSRSKSMLLSLLGKKKSGKQSKKVLNSHSEVL